MNDLLKTYADVLERRSAEVNDLVSSDMLVTAEVALKDIASLVRGSRVEIKRIKTERVLAVKGVK